MYGNNNWNYSNNGGGYPPYGINTKSSGSGIGGGLGSRSLSMNPSLSPGLEAELTAGFNSLMGGRRAIGNGGGYGGFNGMINGSGSLDGSGGIGGGIGPICSAPMGGSGLGNANNYNRSGPYPMNSHNMGGDFSFGQGYGQHGHSVPMGGGCGFGLGRASGSGMPIDNSSRHATNLIVNYLPQEYTDRDLYTLFRKIGAINTCRIMRHYQSGYSFGYGFVDFVSPEDAERAIEAYNGYSLGSKRLKVSYARPGGEDIKDTNLYVTNLPRTIDDETLRRIFAKYGQIVQMNILRDKITFKPKGVAFVRFNKRAEAQEAIAALNNIIPEGGMQPLSVRLAEEHGKAKANLYMMQKNIGMAGVVGGVPMPPVPPMNMQSNPNQPAVAGPMGPPMGPGGGSGQIGAIGGTINNMNPIANNMGNNLINNLGNSIASNLGNNMANNMGNSIANNIVSNMATNIANSMGNLNAMNNVNSVNNMGAIVPYNNMAAAAAVAAAYRDEAMERTVRSVLEGVCERIFGLDSDLFKEMLIDETKKKFQQCPYG